MRLYNVRVLDRHGLSAPRTVELDVIGDEEREASGLILSPGWVDLHAHLRDPGFPEKETLASGTASAAFGGFTQVIAMANTNPVIDDPELVRGQIARAAELPVQVSFAAAVTKNLEGRALTDTAALRAAGAVALSDDGRHALDGLLLRQALQQAAVAGLPVFVHAQKEELGRSAEAETSAVGEALEALADSPGAHLHLQHVSTAVSVRLIAQAKRDGLRVSGEVTPHHLALTGEDVVSMGPWGNVSPPLRSAADRDAVRAALVDGVIDAIATDHAPHDAAAKAAGANGFHGFETALGVVLSCGLDWRVVHRACVEAPRQIMGLPPPDAEGQGRSGADWILIDPDLEWTVDPSSFRSKGRNSPFAGRRLAGKTVMTISRGQVLFERMVQRV